MAALCGPSAGAGRCPTGPGDRQHGETYIRDVTTANGLSSSPRAFANIPAMAKQKTAMPSAIFRKIGLASGLSAVIAIHLAPANLSHLAPSRIPVHLRVKQ